jgi:hypothetical protein
MPQQWLNVIRNVLWVTNGVLYGSLVSCERYAGQSNMAFGLGQDINASAECAITGDYPNIRFTTFVGDKQWKVPSPATACTGKGFAPFSAVCWYANLSLVRKPLAL